jgi:hypothetical protein
MIGRARDTKADASDVAAYVATMTGELKAMAEQIELSVLAHLLELARLEAEARARDSTGESADGRCGEANN